MSDERTPARLEQLLEALLQEHRTITSLQAGRIVAGPAAALLLPEAELVARGRAWCHDLRRTGRLVAGSAVDTWIRPPRATEPNTSPGRDAT